MDNLKGTRPFFITICLIFSISLCLINSATITISDNDFNQNSIQLSKSVGNNEINNNPYNYIPNIEQLSDASLNTKKTKTDKPITLLNKQDTDTQKLVSRGTKNRNTYYHVNETEKPTEATIPSASQPKVSPNTPIQTDQNTQSEVDSQYENDLNLLARLITAEAQGEPYDAQVAVGAVVINRLESGLWANTIKDVIYQNIDGYYQFTPVVNGWINKAAKPKSIEAAKTAMEGIDPTNGAQFYYDDTTTNEWILSKPISIKIGHMIYAY